ncbi:MAG: ComEA family DNA-binding protein [Erysipelotrichia bacterium]|nr:ComEA family DNA-binding protein [Erysipelotrichia bacterium]
MKPLLVFIFLILCAISIDLKPVSLDSIRKDTIIVTVQGEVNKPGSLILPIYSSVKDALSAAEVTDNADCSGINPQTILHDKDILNIPKQPSDSSSEIVMINSASLAQLQTLPGIGHATAKKIISYRTDHGLFQTVEDLMKVPGIGQAKFNSLKDLIGL